ACIRIVCGNDDRDLRGGDGLRHEILSTSRSKYVKSASARPEPKRYPIDEPTPQHRKAGNITGRAEMVCRHRPRPRSPRKRCGSRSHGERVMAVMLLKTRCENRCRCMSAR